MTEDEIVGWHDLLDGREFEQALGVGDEQEILVRFSPWSCNELDTTEYLNRTEVIISMWASLVSWEKAMATHSSTLAWKIPWMEEPDRAQSMGSLGVGHD